MISPKKRFLLLLVSLSLLGMPRSAIAQTKPAQEPSIQPKIEAKAIAILKAMSERLAAARTMTFTAVSTEESPSRIGPPLAYTTVSEVALQRPNKLKVITPGDGPASEFYYNGKKIVAYAPAENLVAVADAPPNIDAVLKLAYEAAAIYFPFTDVIVADPYRDIADGLKIAFYIGQSKVVDGTTTDMIAIANDQVFAQVWIGTKDKLPRMIRAVYRDDPSRLRHQVTFTNWQLDKPLSPEIFGSARADGAKPIPFKRPEPEPQESAPASQPAQP